MGTLRTILKTYFFASLNLLLLATASYFLLLEETPIQLVAFFLIGGYVPTILAELRETKDPKFALVLRLCSLTLALFVVLQGGLKNLLG